MIAGALLSSAFADRRERRLVKARWDRDRLGAYGRFLVSANEAFRNPLSAHDAIRAGEAAIDDCREAAFVAFERMHQDSEAHSLLAGSRDDPCGVGPG